MLRVRIAHLYGCRTLKWCAVRTLPGSQLAEKDGFRLAASPILPGSAGHERERIVGGFRSGTS